MTMKIGVSGSREGMNQFQRDEVYRILKLIGKGELHHGDCVGVDAEVAEIARSLGFRIIGHPPLLKTYRAYFSSDEERTPQEYLIRNRNIVDETELLIGVPKRDFGGGTWHTINYSIKKSKQRIIIKPNEII